ncbi:hypothetical protein IGB42_02651 [Andreprevotia sp. IGB-42]|uniref:glycoside hydrolase family 108 protein n=1 Tax=Andreprevotia sp. IGB-42 TaxID=2497473 RepID=UPI00135AE4B9|nr:glycosyl hydrolase 108 family protein [Andreprevotia sp. IGB-42]KAF0812808.1 hypothetical protein IGB42_02651 [Andreprevotia sp. IGB-42]
MDINSLIDGLISREGGYANDAADQGGETMWGITIAEARANGYAGAMRDLPRSKAIEIYTRRYWIAPGFSQVAILSMAIAGELFDTGVNCGPATAATMLQRSLNALNQGGADYADIAVDGEIGPATLRALSAYLNKRGQTGVTVMLRALNCLQGARYVELCEKKPSQERFLFGWLANRVGMA